MRLLETERAAASADMLESHKTLIKLDGELSTAKEGMSADKEALKQLEARQAVLQQDVERLRERQEVQAKIKHLERIKPYIQYRDSKNTTKNAQRAKEAAKRELEILVADMVPAMERPKQKKRYKECVQAALRERQSALEDKEGDVSRQKNRVIQRLEREFEEQTTKIRGEETVEDKRKEDVKKCKRQIEHLKRAQEQGPPEIDITELNARIVRIASHS